MIKDVIVGCLVIAILSSCATQKRCLEKFGTLEPLTIRDTVYVPKEVVKFRLQTIIDTLQVVDTFTIEKERLRAVFTRDTVLIECEADTIYTEKIVKMPAIKEVVNDKRGWYAFGILLLALVIAILIGKV